MANFGRLTNAGYRARGGYVCPNCRQHGHIHTSPDWVHAECGDCGATWQDCYKLAGYTELHIPDGIVTSVGRGGSKTVAITFKGVTRSVPAWARALSISYATLRRRLQEGTTDIEALFGPLAGRKPVVLTINGVAKTRMEWAETAGINITTLNGRIRRGLPLAQCVAPPQRAALLTRNGVTKTIREWSEELGISVTAITSRRNLGWPEDRLLVPLHTHYTYPEGRSANLMTIGGETKPLSAWAKVCGVPYQTIYGRFKRGLSPEECVGPPLRPRGPQRNPMTIDGVTRPLGAWAKLRGLSYSIVYGRFKRGLSPEECLNPVIRRTNRCGSRRSESDVS